MKPYGMLRLGCRCCAQISKGAVRQEARRQIRAEIDAYPDSEVDECELGFCRECEEECIFENCGCPDCHGPWPPLCDVGQISS